jgi:hypothetical protein
MFFSRKRKQLCIRCGRRRHPAVVAPLAGGTLILCERCRDELRKITETAADELGVTLELAEE